ncbi:peptide ABC transporter substrate-binding protein [Entomospira culicis]|uniref:Peptide ABC transporter substrate-binding protein n=1 Tax=Entomospira culicis TaxID=2719989 RepID=A0A968GFU7_9SPIO|nr:peptide ABC transporter substrate-binding protein [Entomospira culicis]NIZ19372.1 peptide ABC transporter substrate-binding protein [Entomospira culicis]NIZ69723.1 peptide ABC transporter substrate-binding protein [Entomospira culicis]WDI36834.1 peptide ABC transporter substrate-binding protein [Entomospira culicis]WDI38463.1 peptide ABC transporter substrate-binding protein [Entomospira culicis]
MRTWVKWLGWLVLSLFWLGCQASSTGERPFHLIYARSMTSLNPLFATDLTSYNFLHNIHEGLMTYDVDGEVVLGLLSSVEVSTDGLVYDFYLKEGLGFSDGMPLTMNDVYRSWMYVLDPKNSAPFAHLFDVIVGAKAFRLGESGETPAIDLLSDYHMRVQLERPFFFFLELLTNPTFQVLHQSWLEGQALMPRVSGAYYIDKQEQDGTMFLKANPYHYAYEEGQTLKEIKVSFVSNGSVAYQLFRQLEADWLIRNMPLSLVRREQPNEFFHQSPANSTYFILFNHDIPKYQDVRVRKALSIAISREDLAHLLEERPQALSYITPFGEDRPEIDQDLAKAKVLIAEAGYSKENPLRIDYRYSSSWLDRMVAEYLQSAWQAIEGVEVRLEAIESARYRELWRSGDFEMIRVSWVMSDYEDGEDFLRNFSKENPFMYMRSGYHNEDFEDLLAQADVAENRVARAQLLADAEKMLLLEEYAAIGLFAPYNYHLVNRAYWQGFAPNRRDIHLLRYLRKNNEDY